GRSGAGSCPSFSCGSLARSWPGSGAASQPKPDRGRPIVLVAVWWACWLLAWVTGFRETTRTANGVVTHSLGLWFEGTTVSMGFAALAAVLFAAIIWRVSGRLGASKQPVRS